MQYNDLSWINKEKILEYYGQWLSEDVGLLFCKIQGTDYSYYVGKASKRGNDVYRYKTLRRWEIFRKGLKKKRFFDIRAKFGKTRALFITLTYKAEGHFADAWKDIGKMWNTFIYPEIVVFPLVF